MKCCKTGPGPYKEVKPEVYNYEANNPKGYNTKCMYFNEETEKCDAWNTNKVPSLCKTWICWLREYSSKELKAISKLIKEEDLC